MKVYKAIHNFILDSGAKAFTKGSIYFKKEKQQLPEDVQDLMVESNSEYAFVNDMCLYHVLDKKTVNEYFVIDTLTSNI